MVGGGDTSLGGLIWCKADSFGRIMDGMRCWSYGFKGGGCLNDERYGGGMGIGVCSRFGGYSRKISDESRVIINEGVGKQGQHIDYYDQDK